jgi:hypothetical protein
MEGMPLLFVICFIMKKNDKSFWGIYSIIIFALTMSIISCDSRYADMPELYVSIGKDTLYTHVSHKDTFVSIFLTGDYPDLYANKYIDLHYDHSLGTVITGNSGDRNFFFTNEHGMANGFIVANEDLDFDAEMVIRFVVRDFSSIRTNKEVLILRPFISDITAQPATIRADGEQASTITVTMTPRISNQNIIFSSTAGELSPTESLTTGNGTATTTIKSSNIGSTFVRARLENYTTRPDSIRINFIP